MSYFYSSKLIEFGFYLSCRVGQRRISRMHIRCGCSYANMMQREISSLCIG